MTLLLILMSLVSSIPSYIFLISTIQVSIKVLLLIHPLFNTLIINTLEYTTFVTDKKRRIFAIFLANYKRASINKEIFSNKETTIL